MIRTFLFSIFLTSLAYPVLADRPEKSDSLEIILQVGESRKVPIGSPVQMENSKSLKLKAVDGKLLLLATKPGSLSLQVGPRRYEIQILSGRQMRTLRFLQHWVQSQPGLSVTAENGIPLLRGRLFGARGWLEMPRLCPWCQYRSRFEASETLQKNLVLDLSRFLKKKALPVPPLRWSENGLQWSLPRGPEQQALTLLSENWGIEIRRDDSAVEVSPLIQTQIFIMEIRRDWSRKYGLQWPQSVTAQILGETPGLSALEFSAHAMEAEGHGRVLASPSLLCRSGQEAEFFAGGEFPIKIFSFRNQDVVWKKYGIHLKVKPLADRWGRMNIGIETEVSSLDDSRKVDGLPGLFTNRVASHFDLAQSTTIAISGLIKNERGQSWQGVPGLAQLPVLGSLFSSREFRENRTELLIFVRPQVVDLQAQAEGSSHE